MFSNSLANPWNNVFCLRNWIRFQRLNIHGTTSEEYSENGGWSLGNRQSQEFSGGLALVGEAVDAGHWKHETPRISKMLPATIWILSSHSVLPYHWAWLPKISWDCHGFSWISRPLTRGSEGYPNCVISELGTPGTLGTLGERVCLLRNLLNVLKQSCKAMK